MEHHGNPTERMLATLAGLPTATTVGCCQPAPRIDRRVRAKATRPAADKSRIASGIKLRLAILLSRQQFSGLCSIAGRFGPLVQKPGQVPPGCPVEAPVMLHWQRAGKAEDVVVVVLFRAAMRRAPALAGRVHVETVAVGTENRPHAAKAKAPHLAAFRQRPGRNLRRLPADPAFERLAQTLRAIRPNPCQPQTCG